MQFAIYSRKSRFTGKGESIGNQIELCRRFIAQSRGESEAEAALIYEDEGYSGGNLERPQFRRMMRDAERGVFGAIVVYRLDRISRNIGDFASLIEHLAGKKIEFISIREQFDTSSPMGRAMMYIASVFSQLERETIAERIRDNMRELARTGRWLGGITPLGYASETVEHICTDGKLRRSCRLRQIPGEIRIVKLIYNTFLSSGTLADTVRFLEKSQCRTREGNPFSRFTVKGILTNPVYMIADEDAWHYFDEHGCESVIGEKSITAGCGIMAYNRTVQRKGSAHEIRPIREWIIACGGHEGIIPGAVWVRVQQMLAGNCLGERRSHGNSALLSGILYCGECGARMRVKLTDRTDACGARFFSYICTGKEKTHGQQCTNGNIRGNQLDAAVIRMIGDLPEDTAYLMKRLGRIVRLNKEELKERIPSWSETLHSMPTEEKRNIVRCLIEKVIWQNGQVHIRFRGDEE